jgi:hypothetical protein
MNSLRKVVGILLAMTLMGFAQLSAAQATDKLYSIQMSVVGTHPTFGTKLSATVHNATPIEGNSSFNSFDLSIDLNWTINPAGPVEITGNSGGQPDLSVAGHLKVANLKPVRPQKSVTVTFYVTTASCGDGTWSAVVWSGANFSGSQFTGVGNVNPVTPVPCALLACGGPFTVTYSTTIPGMRGPYNSDGTCNFIVPIYVTDFLVASHTVHFRWPVGAEPVSEPDGVFQYTASDTGPDPKLAWKNYKDAGGNDTGQPAFLSISDNGLNCLAANSFGDYFPRPYGRLQSRLSSSMTDNVVKVDTTTGQLHPLPAPGTDIVIGNERMKVLSVATSSSTLTVQRAVANTALDAHSKYAPVMFTPLAILPATPICSASSPTQICPYVGGSQAQMCLITPSTQYPAFTIIDIGDGWMTSNE